jgi:hypothetical protein
MAKQTINIGASPDDTTGDSLRVGGDKINDNFDELYQAVADLVNGRQVVTPVAGGTTNIAASTAKTVEIYFDHAASVAGQTINFPAPVDGQRFLLMFREAMTSVTLVAPTGTLLGSFTSVSANARAGWVYNAATTRWYRYS